MTTCSNATSAEGRDDDVLAMDIALKMLESHSPFGHILGILHDLLGTFNDLEGFAQIALGTVAVLNIDPKAALNPAFAYLASTSAWKKIQPGLAEELRRRGIGAVHAMRANTLPKRKPSMQ